MAQADLYSMSFAVFSASGISGWAYVLFSDGIAASVSVSYELEFNMALDLAEMRFPEYEGNIVANACHST
ncbi:MAG: hypothetical protein U0694_17350 [Anaerolineae bacterium]